jgi:cholesterol transport system auxiliary component
MTRSTFEQRCWISAAVLCLTFAGGCAALSASKTPHPAHYALDNTANTARAPILVPAASPRQTALTLIVSPPHAASGITSQRIIYVREAHKLEYFAHSEWIDPPARMLAPLIVAAIEKGSAFRAVVQAPSAAAGDLRLDTEIIRLQHDFQTQPSHVRFTLRAYLVEEKTRRVLAWREFDAAAPAASGDPYGGVVAANQAVQTVLESLSVFCSEVARGAQIDK